MKAKINAKPLSPELLRRIDAYWRANDLSVGQIYLFDNPLLKQPLTLEHIKLRLLGHWGTTPGLKLTCVQLRRSVAQAEPGLDAAGSAGRANWEAR